MGRDATEIPEKLFYKIGEVCRYTDTQPYVLRFWESEFPLLAPEKNRSGQRIYSRQDIDLIFRIKKLLYEEEYTIAGARKRLEQESPAPPAEEASPPEPARPRGRPGRSGGAAPGRARGAREEAIAKPEESPKKAETKERPGTELRKENERLRRRVAEVEQRWKRAESALEEAERSAEAYRERCERTAARLEAALRSLRRKGKGEDPSDGSRSP